MKEFLETGIRMGLVYMTCGVEVFAALVIMNEMPEEATPKFCLVVILLWPVVFLAMLWLVVRETWRGICNLKKAKETNDE